MMDSMSALELDGVQKIEGDGHRILRIAKGAGVEPDNVNILMEEYKKMSKMIGGLGKSGLLTNEKKMAQMMKNPQ